MPLKWLLQAKADETKGASSLLLPISAKMHHMPVNQLLPAFHI